MTATGLATVPTLAEIASDPSKIAQLSGPVAAALGAAFSGLATSCALRAVLDADARAGVRELLGTVGLEEAAALLGIKPSTLRHRAKHPPYVDLRVDNGTRRLRFSAGKIRAYLDRPPLDPRGAGSALSRRRGLRGLDG